MKITSTAKTLPRVRTASRRTHFFRERRREYRCDGTTRRRTRGGGPGPGPRSFPSSALSGGAFSAPPGGEATRRRRRHGAHSMRRIFYRSGATRARRGAPREGRGWEKSPAADAAIRLVAVDLELTLELGRLVRSRFDCAKHEAWKLCLLTRQSGAV